MNALNETNVDFRPALAHLDLSCPNGFLLALIRSRYVGSAAPLSDDEWHRAIETVEALHPVIFDLHGSREAVSATWDLLLGLGNLQELYGETYHDIPVEWLGVFAEAFRRGQINPIVFGAAVRVVTTMRRTATWPAWYQPRRIVQYMRDSSPLGMMNESEYAIWHELPPMVTVYRGGCVNALVPVKAVQELAAGTHWSTSHEVAEHYMRGRSWQRRGDPTAGLPAIIKATVPKRLILAYCDRNGEQEVFLDFEQVAPEMVIDLGIQNYQPRQAA